MTHGAKNGGSFSEMMGPKHIKLNTFDFWVVSFTYTPTKIMHICILTADYTVKPVLSSYSKKKTNYRLMQVISIAECSAILSICIELPFVIKIFVLSFF